MAPTASAEEVKRAYKKVIGQYHPDRVSGLGEELIALAEKKSKEINAAYTMYKRLNPASPR